MTQNLDIIKQGNPILTARVYIKQILDQLLIDYQTTQDEREKLSNWEENKSFSILGIIEVLTDEIRGYSFQIVADKKLTNSQDMINQLNTLKIFDIPELTQWYFLSDGDYPKIKRYIENLNYLRLLIIEYLSNIETIELQTCT
ncbi:hypothetical protein PCC8801_1089 [Rippkaea orientalis PCC 8801]|uniref:Uncharacterized protein n=1 Tax=Rippkaea orientalis (strain PCC 8801 / RF-1) TaxID=41431 RepID=B7K122_RIPO1|nr:hypothetical protein [Rippkaea orientalis]ACK65163.1 hypothetical protein PCC8801_1089 [Rippkaea orientalis PCC 8801]